MELNDFAKKINRKLSYFNIELNMEEIKLFYQYMQVLIKWNEKMNLTAIVEPDEIILKHFVDSITINKFITSDSTLIDIGTGAGFPGVPIKIINENISVTLLDSLNKRIVFLDEVINLLELKNIKTLHGRAEDYGINKEFRQKYDYVTSRAVAPLNYLLEYMLPFIKVGGTCICMKGSNIEEELLQAKNALTKLGGKILQTVKMKLPESDIERNIIIIKKINDTPPKYPRKAGMPKKIPL